MFDGDQVSAELLAALVEPAAEGSMDVLRNALDADCVLETADQWFAGADQVIAELQSLSLMLPEATRVNGKEPTLASDGRALILPFEIVSEIDGAVLLRGETVAAIANNTRISKLTVFLLGLIG